MNATPTLRDTARHWPVRLALVLYLALLAWGSLYPLNAWRLPDHVEWGFLFAGLPRFITRTDITTNLLAYLPLGMLIAAALAPRMRLRLALFWALAAGAAFSTVMEFLQLFSPNRIASNLDILTNAAGALAGALLYGLLRTHRWPGRVLLAWRHRWFRPGTLTNAGLLLVMLWLLSQLSLELPSLVAGKLRAGFVPFWEADIRGFRPDAALIFAMEILVVGTLAQALLRREHAALPAVALLGAAVILCKFAAAAILVKWTVMGRLLSLEAVTGFAVGLAALLVTARSPGRHPAAVGGAFALSLLITLHAPATRAMEAALAAPAAPARLFNVTGLAAMTATVWPYLAALFLAAHWFVHRSPGSGSQAECR